MSRSWRCSEVRNLLGPGELAINSDAQNFQLVIFCQFGTSKEQVTPCSHLRHPICNFLPFRRVRCYFETCGQQDVMEAMDCVVTNGESFHTETQFSLNVRVQEFGTRTPISSSNFYACNSDLIRSVEYK